MRDVNRRPRRARTRIARAQTLIRIHTRRRQRAQRFGVVHQTADKRTRQTRQSARIVLVQKQVVARLGVPQRAVHMRAAARQIGERFGHKRRVQAAFFGQSLGHKLEKRDLISGFEGVGKLPIDFKLTVGVFVIVLINAITQLVAIGHELHQKIGVAQERQLPVTRFRQSVLRIGDARRAAFVIEQKKLRLDSQHKAETLRLRFS